MQKWLIISSMLLASCSTQPLHPTMDELLAALEIACAEEPLICRNHHEDH